MTTVRGHVDAAKARLVSAGLERQDAAIDAEILARNVLGWDRATYLTDGRTEAPGDFPERYRQLLARRSQREPVSLITGHKEFWGLDFDVTSDVLTPRPETEILVEAALTNLKHYDHTPHVVDVGTGSGCVAIVIAQNTDAQVTATDVSRAAIAVAQRNAERHGVSDRIRWVCSPLLDRVHGAPDIIVANLPYIPRSDIAQLPPEVRIFEPHTALDGGPDGLQLVTQLVDVASSRLAPSGYLIVELGLGQTVLLSQYLEVRPALEIVSTQDDLRGIPRVMTIQRRLAGSGCPERDDDSTPYDHRSLRMPK
jgi:release factor glutamine methyltransferase